MATTNCRFQISANPLDKGVWGFEINPIGHTMRPQRDQNIVELLDGSAFIIEPDHDSTILTMTWENIPFDTYGTFLFGDHENLAFDKVFSYFTQGATPSLITDMTYESFTHDTLLMPFANIAGGLSRISLNANDRIFVGSEDRFNGILFDFEDYHSFQFRPSDGSIFVNQIDLRFSPASGNLAAGDSITYDGATNADDDDTELFQHYGQLRWASVDTENWAKVSLDTILANTSDLTAPTGFSSTTEYYWCEVKITPETTVTTSITPRLEGIKAGLDSLGAIAATKSNGIIPIWWLNIPDVLKHHKPRGFRDDDWIGVKVTNYTAQLTNPTEDRWTVQISFIPVEGRESPQKFKLDRSRLDGENFLG